jgi:hypothetical protein
LLRSELTVFYCVPQAVIAHSAGIFFDEHLLAAAHALIHAARRNYDHAIKAYPVRAIAMCPD